MIFQILEGAVRIGDVDPLGLPIQADTGGKAFAENLEPDHHVGDQQETQLKRTLEVAQTRLEDLEQRRTELDAAISEMKSQMDLVRDMLGDVPEDDRDA